MNEAEKKLSDAAFAAGQEIKAAYEGQWLNPNQVSDGVTMDAVNRFIAMASPATICRLIIELDEARESIRHYRKYFFSMDQIIEAATTAGMDEIQFDSITISLMFGTNPRGYNE